MIASDFTPPSRAAFSRRARVLSSIPLYGLGVPVVRVLDATGVWPRMIAAVSRRMITANFGDYQPSATDVFVCAGFKSGTTWALQIATQIAFRGAAEFGNIHDVVPWPDSPPQARRQIIPLQDDSPRRRAPTGLRIIKTHRSLEHIPFSTASRYIAVVRDPKDVVVSGYHFLKSMIYGPLMPSVEHWIDLNLAGQTGHDSWSEHLASYWRVRNHPNVLFMTYESLKRDMTTGIDQIVRFMGVDLTAAERAAVLKAASWETMKRDQAKFDPGQVLPWSGQNYFLRRGKSGESAELLSKAQQQRIDRHWRADLLRLGCVFPYDEAFGRSA